MLDPSECPCCRSPALLKPVLVPNPNRGVATTYWAVVCTNDSCRIQTQPYTYEDREQAVNVWNLRVP